MSSIENNLEPLVRIFHPSDFTPASEIAFAHALKLALDSKADLEIMHVTPHLSANEADVHWSDFPGVRPTLARWGIIPKGASREDVVKQGMDVKKIVLSGDPVSAILEYCHQHPPDLLVLATHQYDGLARWLHKQVAEPLARGSRAMTLFVPHEGTGFISLENGSVKLRRILLPVDHEPSGQKAVDEAYTLAVGLDCPDVEFRLLHVGETQEMPALKLPERGNWKWEKRLVQGDVIETILQEASAWSPDLVALTTQGHMHFLDALRGSTTERVLRGVHCPVLAIPA
jgi:nucleotide-binding universal stress UspA family protein